MTDPTGYGCTEPIAVSRLKGVWRRLRRLMGHRDAPEILRDTIEELLEQKDEAGSALAAAERPLLLNVLNLANLTARDVMVPHADICAVEIDTPLSELVKLMIDMAHSRLPVYRRTLDDVAGMVHIKDLVASLHGDTQKSLAQIVRPVLFVAPSMPILELLLQMRVSRMHMALVVDEYGGIDGLITIEDLVEQIVGEIEDEHDTEATPPLAFQPDGSIEADARLRIEEFEARVGAILSQEERGEDIDTLGGLVSYLVGRVPRRGEVVAHSSGIEFDVIDAEPRRIRRLRIRGLPQPEEAEKQARA